MTLTRRKRWVRPQGTGDEDISLTFMNCPAIYRRLDNEWQVGGERRTVSVVFEVDELIAPLGDDSQGIFEEGNNNKETADGREVPAVTDPYQHKVFALMFRSVSI